MVFPWGACLSKSIIGARRRETDADNVCGSSCNSSSIRGGFEDCIRFLLSTGRHASGSSMTMAAAEEKVEVRVRGTKRVIASPHKELSDHDFSLTCGLFRDGTSWLIGVLLLLMGSGAVLVRCLQLPSQHQMTSSGKHLNNDIFVPIS